MYVRVVLLDQQIPGRRAGGSGEVNCRSFRVLPLHSRAFIFFLFPPFSFRVAPRSRVYLFSLHRAPLLPDNEGKNFNDLRDTTSEYFFSPKLSKFQSFPDFGHLRKKKKKNLKKIVRDRYRKWEDKIEKSVGRKEKRRKKRETS